MPRERKTNVSPVTNGFETVETEITGENPRDVVFKRPVVEYLDSFLSSMLDESEGSAQKVLGALFLSPDDDAGDSTNPSFDSKESAKSALHRLIITAIEKMAVDAARVSAVSESTWVTIPGLGRKNLMEFSLKGAIRAINGYRDAALTKAEETEGWETANAEQRSKMFTDALKSVKAGAYEAAARQFVKNGKMKEVGEGIERRVAAA